MSQMRILIVHPDPSIVALMNSMLQTLGYPIDEAPNDRVAVRMLEHSPVDLVLTGADPSDSDALEFLSYLRRKYPKIPVILLFPTSHPERSREAQLRGALAVLRFPLPANALRAAVSQALGEPESTPAKPLMTPIANGAIPSNGHASSNGSGPAAPRFSFDSPAPARTSTLAATEPFDNFVGDDPAYRQAFELARTIAPTSAPVLVVGERGVGKSSLARIIHEQGARPHGPFVEASCSNLKESVLDVELFGRRNGGYAEPDRPGKVELARGGTLFLDDVSALTPDLQLKLLRLLRDGLNEPVGATAPERADVRVLMGTREELATLVPDGRFRQDLYYRIGVITLKLPPLRHRGSDLERLADHFRNRFARQLAKDVRCLAPESLALLHAHAWPGNVRELAETIERAVVVCRGQRIEPNHLALNIRDSATALSALSGSTLGSMRSSFRQQSGPSNTEILPLKEALEGPERQLILEALEALNWNRQETARMLDINRTTLYKKMKKYGLLFDEPAWAN
jgi:DNA-binding NtrC family response regulator